MQGLRLSYREEFAQERNKVKFERMVDYLISAPITSISQAQENLDMESFTTIQRHILKLESYGIVREVTGKGRNRIYRAEQILKILEGRS